MSIWDIQRTTGEPNQEYVKIKRYNSVHVLYIRYISILYDLYHSLEYYCYFEEKNVSEVKSV